LKEINWPNDWRPAPGHVVEITSGPHEGYTGIVVRVLPDGLLTMLGNGLTVMMSEFEMTPLPLRRGGAYGYACFIEIVQAYRDTMK
jgi:transcription antitermination factor NusG